MYLFKKAYINIPINILLNMKNMRNDIRRHV
jgi:hypothetical protein